MIFQWYLFVLIFLVAIFARLTGQIQVINNYGHWEERYKWLPVLMVVIPLIYFAGTRSDMGFGDTSAYRNSFKNLPSEVSAIPSYIVGVEKDKGFTVFSIIIKSIIGNRDVIYFTIIAGICLLCVFWVYKNYSSNFLITAFLFVASADYIQWTYNGMRQFIAVAVCFACIGLILKKKYVSAIIIIGLVSTIHATALLMIPMIFIVQGKPWNKKTMLYLVLIIVAVAYLEHFTDILTNFMENSQYSKEVNQFTEDTGTSIFRVAVYSLPTIIAFIIRKKIQKEHNPVINLCVNMSAISMGFYVLSYFTSGIFIGRIPIYFSLYNYILLPWEVEHTFNKPSAKIIYMIMFVAYMFYYYYQVSVVWRL